MRGPPSLDYRRLSLAEARAQLETIAREAQRTFGRLDARQLNWRPDEARWSVAQCFEHLLTANRLVIQAADDAINGVRRPTIWQRLPIWPTLFGQMLIRSQAPNSNGKFSAPSKARPATSGSAPDVIVRFAAQHRDAVARVRALDERRAAHAIMTSPFMRVGTYSVVDGWRLFVAHDWRHLAQAHRVTLMSGFPPFTRSLANAETDNGFIDL